MTKIGVVGFGIVGQATAYAFSDEEIKWYDKYKAGPYSLQEVIEHSEIIFVCVPTPCKDNKIDLSIMDEVMAQITHYTNNTEKIIVIKSTVIPGTTAQYQKQYQKSKVCCHPEFLTEKNYLHDAVHPDRLIVGACNEEVSKQVSALLRKRFPDIPIFQTDPTSAEIAKYAANCFFATKVMYANAIYDLCEKLNAQYDTVKQMVLADHRIGKTHFDITQQRGFGGKCFPKDLLALIGLYEDLGLDSSFLRAVWENNLRIRKEKDWKQIPGVQA